MSSQSSQKPTGIAILGAGLFPLTAYLPSLLPHADLFTLKAIYSRSTSSAQSLASAYADALPDLALADIGVYSDAQGGLDELLKREDVKVVLVALPIVVQSAVVERCWTAGKHVLSEKPVAKDVATAQALIKTYNDNYKPKGIIWRVAENWEREPVFLAASKMLASGDLGELQSFAWSSATRTEEGSKWQATSWRTVPEHQGGFILDAGVHEAAALRLLLSARYFNASQLTGQASLRLPHLAPTDTLSALVTASHASLEPIKGTFNITFAAPIGRAQAAPLFEGWCEKGWIEVTQTPGEGGFALRSFDARGKMRGEEKKFERTGVEGEMGCFLGLVRSGGEEDVGAGKPEEVLRDLAFIEAGLGSGGKEVALGGVAEK